MGKRFVSFTLGEGRYCIPVEQVLQIVRRDALIEIPKPPASVEGAINLRGDIVPVVNLRSRLTLTPAAGGAHREAEPRKRRVVITRLDNRMYGFGVDEVREIVDIDDAGISLGPPADSASPLVAGTARTEGGTFLILDLARVLAAIGGAADVEVEEL